MKPTLLDEETIQRELAKLTGWKVAGREISKDFEFRSYMDGIEFVQKTAALADNMNHHPDLMVGWKKVGVRLTTHSAGGLTALDLALASQIDSL